MLVDALFTLAIVLCGSLTIPSVAHALELPGKMRLNEVEYRIVQRIYYPGFTAMGIAEVLAPVVLLVLLLQLPSSNRQFWLVLAAFFGLIAVQGVFWLVTQPVNRHWMTDVRAGRVGRRFFKLERAASAPPRSFTELRTRWEYSHVMRASLSLASLVALAIAA